MNGATLDALTAKLNRLTLKGSHTDCWPWQGQLTRDGYGVVVYRGTLVRAHRLSFFNANGYWPTGTKGFVCHHCDNRKCVNPAHLYAGSVQDNRDTMQRTGHWNRKKTHCLNGHKLFGYNAYIDKKTGKRKCRECTNRRTREYRKSATAKV